ncbi:hypothetical protein [Sphingobium sp. Ant17]|jgi:hypothetical protein|uniref:hypothetical protein n=1 Tax=Sphingobium sp. Ant17 TaxID=1461752 RepID=UPI001377A23E|nr:hypothetical protein [Sphingobium sp. Ant17]
MAGNVMMALSLNPETLSSVMQRERWTAHLMAWTTPMQTIILCGAIKVEEARCHTNLH